MPFSSPLHLLLCCSLVLSFRLSISRKSLHGFHTLCLHLSQTWPNHLHLPPPSLHPVPTPGKIHTCLPSLHILTTHVSICTYPLFLSLHFFPLFFFFLLRPHLFSYSTHTPLTSLLPSFHPSTQPQPLLCVPAALFSPTNCKSNLFSFLCHIFTFFTVMSIFLTPSALSFLFPFLQLTISLPIFTSFLQSSCSGVFYPPALPALPLLSIPQFIPLSPSLPCNSPLLL